jgi:CheY-like chemotaxis protein
MHEKERSRILFLEDEVILSLTYQTVLEDLGIGPVTAVNGIDEAAEAIDSESFDIAVLDVNVGGTSSIGLARKLIQDGCRVVFATGYSFDPKLFDGLECQVLRKPYEEGDLKERVLTAHKERVELAQA